MMGTSNNHYQLSKLLALLMRGDGSERNYSYVDKVANSSSTDMAMYYLREALRDFMSMKESGRIKGDVEYGDVSREVESIASIEDLRELRKILSTIGSEAISIYMSMGGTS